MLGNDPAGISILSYIFYEEEILCIREYVILLTNCLYPTSQPPMQSCVGGCLLFPPVPGGIHSYLRLTSKTKVSV